MADIVDNAAGGEELSKNAAKKLAKLAEAEKKKAEKAAEKASKAAEQPEKKDKIGADEVEELDPTKYYENRLAAINSMEVHHRFFPPYLNMELLLHVLLISLLQSRILATLLMPRISFTGIWKDGISAQVPCLVTVV